MSYKIYYVINLKITALLNRHYYSPTWVAQLVKNLPAMQETRVQSLGQEDTLEKCMLTHHSILAWEIPWAEESGGLLFMGSQRVGHNRAVIHTQYKTCRAFCIFWWSSYKVDFKKPSQLKTVLGILRTLVPWWLSSWEGTKQTQVGQEGVVHLHMAGSRANISMRSQICNIPEIRTCSPLPCYNCWFLNKLSSLS